MHGYAALRRSAQFYVKEGSGNACLARANTKSSPEIASRTILLRKYNILILLRFL
jgi:hypothetical protein